MSQSLRGKNIKHLLTGELGILRSLKLFLQNAMCISLATLRSSILLALLR